MTVEALIADIERATAALNSTLSRIVILERAIARHGRATGDVGELLVEQIPFGWVTVSYVNPPTGEPVDYFGPVLEETESFIYLDIAGHARMFWKGHVVITRSLSLLAASEGRS